MLHFINSIISTKAHHLNRDGIKKSIKRAGLKQNDSERKLKTRKMKYGSLVLEKKDFVMIKRHQHSNHYIEDYAHKDALDRLDENLAKAFVMALEEMPDDVIRMYSVVTVTSKSGWCATFQLVPPYEDAIESEKVSLQSTLGASVIGRSEGDTLKYGLPGNMMSIKITKVVQSEHYFKADIPEDILTNVLPKHTKNSLTLNI